MEEIVNTTLTTDDFKGQGHGVQCHSRNIKFRTLLGINNRCATSHNRDKVETSMRTMTTIKKFGRRFRNGTHYHEVGVKKPERGPALPEEDPSKIRKQSIQQEEDASDADYSIINYVTDNEKNSINTSIRSLETMKTSNVTKSKPGIDLEMPYGAPFGYSVPLTKSLTINEQKNILSEYTPNRLHSFSEKSIPYDLFRNDSQTPLSQTIAMALEQFPGARPLSKERVVEF